jgi:hypothetical protein
MTSRTRPYAGLLAVQGAAVLMGSILLLLGVLGFVPGVTAHLDQLPITGPGSGVQLFGTFGVSLLQNMIHLVLGVSGLVLYRSYARARGYLLGVGAICLALWLHGMFTAPSSPANLLGANSADNWLHFGFGFAMVVLALTLAGTRVPRGARGEVLVPPTP